MPTKEKINEVLITVAIENAEQFGTELLDFAHQHPLVTVIVGGLLLNNIIRKYIKPDGDSQNNNTPSS
ncbi:hypothetical protein [Bacillus cereus group sp. N24]|uniref:hypothetical protein n=1 Tax=Bacillus cereus group sp. N24 TaxID=2794592 RepID=UPI0018F7C3B3|nr:hypothetical protein [Bacillus cereus group sp. N24]MBJ7950118.1 hypothetical protein [Bacillus cereus group sp. N24]